MIQSAGIEKLARTAVFRVVADIFGKQAGLLAHLLFDRKRGFRDARSHHVSWAKKFGQHAAEAPAVVQFPRPRHKRAVQRPPQAKLTQAPGLSLWFVGSRKTLIEMRIERKATLPTVQFMPCPARAEN